MGLCRIGAVALPRGLALAPMAGVTDRAFRRVCRRCGAEWTVTEMVSAKGLCYERGSRRDRRRVSETIAALAPDELPAAVQLFGNDPAFMAEAARILSSGVRGSREGAAAVPSAIDINMGCPVRKVTDNGEGSALMRDPALAGRIVRAVAGATSLPVTVKIRSGWDGSSINAPEIARVCEAEGAAMICVHARTRQQMYEGDADLSVIAAVKRAVSVPVFGNGGVFTAEGARTMLAETGCDGVMIARGALGNPWLFSEIRAALDGAAYVPPTPEERYETALSQIREMIAEKGERVGVAEGRKRLAWYCRGLRGAADARRRVMRAETAADLVEAAAILREGGADRGGAS